MKNRIISQKSPIDKISYKIWYYSNRTPYRNNQKNCIRINGQRNLLYESIFTENFFYLSIELYNSSVSYPSVTRKSTEIF